MPEYVFTGTAKLRGVNFYITADSEDEAKRRARLGEYDELETEGAETCDWEISPNSCAVNE